MGGREVSDGVGHLCEACGEFIPVAVERVAGPYRYMCADCSGETAHLMCERQRHYPCECADIQYHGGLFHRGEW